LCGECLFLRSLLHGVVVVENPGVSLSIFSGTRFSRAGERFAVVLLGCFLGLFRIWIGRNDRLMRFSLREERLLFVSASFGLNPGGDHRIG
jgi:hypothetical protein